MKCKFNRTRATRRATDPFDGRRELNAGSTSIEAWQCSIPRLLPKPSCLTFTLDDVSCGSAISFLYYSLIWSTRLFLAIGRCTAISRTSLPPLRSEGGYNLRRGNSSPRTTPDGGKRIRPIRGRRPKNPAKITLIATLTLVHALAYGKADLQTRKNLKHIPSFGGI